VLGIMAIWRCFYAVFLDYFNAQQWGSFNCGVDRIQVITECLQQLLLHYTADCSSVQQF